MTSNLLTFPAPRSARLQTFARSDAGFLGGVAYAEKLNLMLWKIYMVSSRKEAFVVAAKKELQPYLEKEEKKRD